MIIIFLVAIFSAIIVLGFVLFSVMRKMENLQNMHANDKGMIMLNQTVTSMNEKVNERLDKAAQVIAAVQKELGTVQERFKGFEEFNELLHPKMRGNIGEQILADMLGQVFSDEHYALQYKFRGGETVDAIIRTKSGIIPIDSKFPLENFKQLTRAQTDESKRIASREFIKAVKKHVDDISKKYLLPDEGTINFAIMYIPSENVYYHILTEDETELLEYAKNKSVLVTSPHGFFNFLRVLLIGFEQSKLQEQAQQIWETLKGVQNESVRFGESMGVLSRHITNAKNAMDTVHAGYDKLSGKLEQIKLIK